VVLAGTPSRAPLLALRALATGAEVYLRTARPGAWEALLRATRGPGATIVVVAPGQPFDAPPAALPRPQLVIVDTPATAVPPRGSGPPVASGPPPVASGPPAAPWRTELVVRDRLDDADVDLLAGADLALLARVSEAEAVLAGAALGLGGTGDWLARVRGDMLAAVVPRRTLRWVMATPTDLERGLLGWPPP
jgi:hypothetical protein